MKKLVGMWVMLLSVACQSVVCEDVDGDGHLPEGTGLAQCPVVGDDCDDGNADVHPGATEQCNEVDDDCNSATSEEKDDDGDGVAACNPSGQADCDDTNSAIKPGATEQCNGIDDNCNGTIDDDVTISTWYQDSDGDGYGNAAVTKSACSQPAGYVSNSTDCKDGNPFVNPGATEQCNGLDDDCDGTPDEGCRIDAPPAATRPTPTAPTWTPPPLPLSNPGGF